MSIYFNTGYAKTANTVAIPNPCTVTLWLYCKGYGDTVNRLFGSDTLWELTINSTYKIKNELYTNFGIQSTTVMALNTWYHIAATANKTTGAGELFINGASEGTAVNHNVAVTDPDYIGIGSRDGASGGEESNCLLEDVRLYNSVLTLKEINEIYNSGIISCLASNLVSAWCRNTKGDLSAVGADTIYDEHGKTGSAAVPSGNVYYYPARKRLRR